MGLLEILKDSASRKYVDLLRDSSDKWANWNPLGRTIRAGDFGNIDGKSGDFIYEGNIYDDSELSTIAQNYPPKHAPGKDELILIKSYDAKSTAQEPGVEGPADIRCIVSIQVKFTKGKGAILVMHQVNLEYVPDELLERLSGEARLKGKQVVNTVFTCQGFAQYLSGGESHTMTLILNSNGRAASGEPNYEWHAEGNKGVLRHGYDTQTTYTPLYGLREFRRTWGIVQGNSSDATPQTETAGRRVHLMCVPLCGVIGASGRTPEE